MGIAVGGPRASARWLALVGIVFGLWGIAQPVSSHAAVYWTEGFGVGAANMDGTNPRRDYYTPSQPPAIYEPLCGVAVNSTHLYMRTYFGIKRVSLDGSPVAEPIVQTPGQSGCGLAIDGSHAYWTDRTSGAIGRVGLEGGEPNAAFITGLGEPCGMAVDGQYVYWSDGWGIGRARLDGTEVQRAFVEVSRFPCGIAVNGQYIYWGWRNGSSIGRAGIDGSDPSEAFIAGTGSIHGLATNSTHLFWANDRYDGFFGSIGRANLDGSSVEQAWIPALRTEEFGVAVDSRPEAPPISLRIPSRPINFGKLTQNRRTGVVFLDVIVPTRGELVVSKPQIGWKVLKGNPPDWVGGTFTWHVKIWAGKGGAASRRVRSQLRRKGKAPVSLQLTYSEENRGPVTTSKRVILVKAKSRGDRRRPSRSRGPTG